MSTEEPESETEQNQACTDANYYTDDDGRLASFRCAGFGVGIRGCSIRDVRGKVAGWLAGQVNCCEPH